MADDPKVRFPRSDTPYARGAAAERMERAPSSDPLAELARLIGQDNVFDKMRKDAGRAQTQPSSGHEPARGSYEPAADRRPQYDQPAETQADYATRTYGHGQPAHDGRAGSPGYAEPYYADGPADPYPVAVQEAFPHGGYDDGYEEAVEPPPERRRGGLVTVAVVLGLAVVGTAAAFGYRAIMGGSSDSAPPPVIAADKAPAKIVPAPSNSDGQTARTGFDRGDKPQSEKVVPREEQPIEMRETKAAAPKMMGPTVTGTTGIGAPAQGAPPLASPSMQSLSTNPNEPKKVRTFAIRPDGSVAPDSAGAKPQNPGARGVTPTQTMPPRPSPAPRPGASMQPGSPAGSLAVTAQGEAARSPAGAPIQTASIRPTESPAATRATMPIANGSHVVQLASQKSESEAQASFRAMQAKYPTVLAGRQPLIRKVELGDRGTYYRAQVGPFASADQANELCSNLKAAGGQCIVQRN